MWLAAPLSVGQNEKLCFTVAHQLSLYFPISPSWLWPRAQSSLSARFEASADWAKEREALIQADNQCLRAARPLAQPVRHPLLLSKCTGVSAQEFPVVRKAAPYLPLDAFAERGCSPYFFVWRNLSFEVRSRSVGTGIIWADALNASLLSKKLHFGSARVTKARMFERSLAIFNRR